MPRGIPITPDELQHIMSLFEDCRKRGMSLMESYQRVGDQVGRDKKVIGIVISRLKPTTRVAQMYARAKAYRLVKRVIKKATVEQAMDILSRPEIGVFSPVTKGEGPGTGGFFLTVNAGDCGAVKMAAIDVTPQKQLEAAEDFNPFAEIEGVEHEQDGHTERRPREVSSESESAITRARRKLEAARSLARGGIGDESDQEDIGV